MKGKERKGKNILLFVFMYPYSLVDHPPIRQWVKSTSHLFNFMFWVRKIIKEKQNGLIDRVEKWNKVWNRKWRSFLPSLQIRIMLRWTTKLQREARREIRWQILQSPQHIPAPPLFHSSLSWKVKKFGSLLLLLSFFFFFIFTNKSGLLILFF